MKTGFLRQHSILLMRLCILGDALVIFVTLYLTLWFFDQPLESHHIIAGLLTALLFETIATIFDLYRSWRVIRFRYEIVNIFLYWSGSIILLISVLFVVGKTDSLNNIEVVTWFFVAFGTMCVVHYTTRLITRYARAFGFDVRRAAFVGANEIAVRMARIFDDCRWMGMSTIGIFDDRNAEDKDRISAAEITLAGDVDDLIKLAHNSQVDVVYMCLPLAAEKRIKKLIDLFSDTTVSIYYCPNFFDFDLMQTRWDEVYGQPVISVVDSPIVGHQQILKRLEDIFIVMVALPILIPMMIVIGLLIKLDSKGPIFFKQDRYGINGASFKMWKFRTMYVSDCNREFSQATRNDPRITSIGAFLRKTSLDEIPQFFNVMVGNMSVVGPRPHPDIVNEDLRRQIHRYMLRHKIKPGITGLAQVSGFRGETESLEKMEQRIAQDLQYIRHWSLILDFKILVKTLFNLSGNNVY